MLYEDIISVENLLIAWQEFVKGKKNRKDVAEFSLNLFENIINLHKELVNKTYNHSNYEAFNISDPRPRNIHKATVKDRLLYHAIYRILYPFFDQKFIHDSYSCRNNKGTHKAMKRFKIFAGKISKNNTKTVYVLKCDIKKFFANIDHKILLNILHKHIRDKDIIWLLEKVIKSFNSGIKDKGLPLGNLISQLLVNIYMNEFDRFIKHQLKIKHYVRYADDFVILDKDKNILKSLLPKISIFLFQNLRLNLHPQKVFIKTLSSGIDFLGFVHFPYCRILRTTTKRRMIKRIEQNKDNPQVIQSYLGLMKHGDCFKIIRADMFGI